MKPIMAAKKSAPAAKGRTAGENKRGRKRAPENETKEAKFVRLAQFRMTKTLANLGQVKRLARYPHTPEQGARIVAALQEALTSIEVSFQETKVTEAKETFKF